MRRPGRCAVLAAALLLAGSALAAIPSASKLVRAVAQQNAAAGRGRALQLDVAVVREDAPPESAPVAVGTLLTDPSGRARLELDLAEGGFERHIRRGREYRMTRDGRPVKAKPPLVPPLTLLQLGSAVGLGASLASLGVDTAVAAFGRSEGRDCFVLGGRERGAAASGRRPAFWVEVDSYEVVRIDLGDGVRYRLGPVKKHGPVRVPSWIGVDAPGSPPLRIQIRGASQTSAAPASFDPGWLSGR